ncbi:MAG TPA: nuclear transport factor 2 family protein [Acidimicrobiales bacterium]|nr:nuclear transport factor 2 family protein [Acidimicrobiales bacterium]
MEREQMDRIVNEHFGYEAMDDIEGVLATLTDDVAHQVVGSPWGELSGKSAVRPFYESLFGALKGESVKPVARWYGEDFVVDETMWTGHVEDGAVFGLAGKSGEVTFRLLHLFEFRGGLISRENVWSDIVTIANQLS